MRSSIAYAGRVCNRCVARGSRNGASYLPRRWNSTETRKWSTPLAKQLSEAIAATGPIPLATFMRMCLTSDMGGYYTSSQEGRDQFGKKGDFITAPEISQIFGELIGIWFVSEWTAQFQKDIQGGTTDSLKGIQLIEVGPGRGTLMDDMLRTIRNWKQFESGIEAVYMVEASPALIIAQKELLCGDAEMSEIDIGFKSMSKYGMPVIWVEHIRFVPAEPSTTPFIVAHEFFDALPIHAFQSIPPAPTDEQSARTSKASNSPQWREMVVSPAPSTTLNLTPTPNGTFKSQKSNKPPEEFQLHLSKSSTPHSFYLPEMSKRHRALKNTPGSLIEISPDSLSYAQHIARLIGGSHKNPKAKPSGAALIIDYGPTDTIPTNSLRGIQNHKRVSPLSSPGIVDLSADVDFTALADAALVHSPGIEVHGPVEQGYFLQSMGIEQRAEMLVKAVKGGDEKERKEKESQIRSSWLRLVDRGPSGMGKVYKVLAFLPENGGERRPAGFGDGFS